MGGRGAMAPLSPLLVLSLSSRKVCFYVYISNFYKCLESFITLSPFLVLSFFFFPDDPSCKGIISLLYSSSFSYLSPPLVDHVTNFMDTCPIRIFLKSLYIAISLKSLFRHYLHINVAGLLGANHLMW